MGELQRQPNPVDTHVGGRIRMRRRVMGLSQESIAESLGLTFQQVQKYERGSNRVSASKLFGIAHVLKVPISYFFEDLPEPGGSRGGDHSAAASESSIRDFLATTEGLELARRFPLIPKGRLRRQVLELVRALTEELEPALVD
jgi:transcriptional regulator with XRE-family HTH domain